MTDYPSYEDQFYLVIRPVAGKPAGVEPHLDVLREITGLDKHTLKEKFSGASIDVITVKRDRAALEEISANLKREGILAATVGKQELRAARHPEGAAGVEIGSNSIGFLSADGTPLLELHGREPVLVVITSRNFKGLHAKRTARHAYGTKTPLTAEEALRHLYMSAPVMDVYDGASGNAARIDSTKFNYTSMGELNKNSVAQNFPVLFEKIVGSSKTVVLDLGFGENTLPFLKHLHLNEKDRVMRDFDVYSSSLKLLYERGVFPEAAAGSSLPIPPVLKDFGNLLLGGAFFNKNSSTAVSAEKGRLETEGIDEEDSTLPPPPDGSVVYGGAGGSALKLRVTGGLLKGLQQLGPPLISYPLSFVIIGSVIFSYLTERVEPLSLAVLSAGLILYSHSFVMLRRKHAVENCPRSNIGTMPMGEVEVFGTARPKYALRAPYSLTNCVYYSYKIYRVEKTQNSTTVSLIGWGESSRLPFYMEDDTGRVTLLPEGAVIKAGRKERFSGDVLRSASSFGFMGGGLGDNTYVMETVIPVGERLYVLGYGHRLTKSTYAKKKNVNEKFRLLKTDRHRLKKYDTDGDGKISTEEWDRAMADIEEEVLRDSLESKSEEDDIAIGAHPSGGLFFISDNREEHIIRSLSWRIPLTLIIGTALTAAGAYFVQLLIRNGSNLWSF